MIDRARLRRAYEKVRTDLLAEQNAAGHWVGELANSAVSTATAVSALSMVVRHASPESGYELNQLKQLVQGGVEWLSQAQNDDGGWGDTDRSLSNIATTMLVEAALRISGAAKSVPRTIQRAEDYIESEGGLEGLRRRYGRDRTFAVPILANYALAGMVPWRKVASLPFELACFPHAMFRFLRLPVVSYAIPALVAIGQAKYLHATPWNPIAWLIRRLAVRPSLERVLSMQPDSGGFLEAAPLTAFVTMSLASTGRCEHPVTRRAVDFLIASVREDGGWPIDTNLATWLTTLSINALAETGEPGDSANTFLSGELVDWLLDCQHRRRHPFTNADPGGWGWTDLSGAVPDADDTPGALLALRHIIDLTNDADAKRVEEITCRAEEGVRWLLDLQNRDGGWPTFCRGWGKLPFDRSGVDLTAHALRALHAWQDHLPALEEGILEAMRRGFAFLDDRQGVEGEWIPLWFGNQYDAEEENPAYGTARVLMAYADMGRMSLTTAENGVKYLLDTVNDDGGWGGKPIEPGDAKATRRSSVEETAVVLETLAMWEAEPEVAERLEAVRDKAVEFLIRQVESGTYREPSPIGFYFAKLWYYEKLYPVVFTAAALGRTLRMLDSDTERS